MPSGSSFFSDSPHLAFDLQKLSKPTLPLSQSLALLRALGRPCLCSCPATPHSQPQLFPSSAVPYFILSPLSLPNSLTALSPLPHSCLPLTWVSFFMCHFSALPLRTAPTLSLCICLSLLPKIENLSSSPTSPQTTGCLLPFPHQGSSTQPLPPTGVLQTPSACAHCPSGLRLGPADLSPH